MKISHSDHQQAPEIVDRLPRIRSHALVDVRTNRWNPFSKLSAVLLDLTSEGFKIEFVESVQIPENASLKLTIPLAPFEIYDKSSIRLHAQVKWFDQGSMRAGGVFKATDSARQTLLARMIDFLRAHDDYISERTEHPSSNKSSNAS